KDYVSPETGDLKKARAWWLKRIDENQKNDVPTVLFFDEYTNAPDALQQLAYSPFNERRLHGTSFDYKLRNGKPGLYVFGAGNRVEDETGAREMVYASKTRVFTVDFEVSAKEWIKWAEENDIDPKIRAFIYANPDALLEKPSTGTACPREWANLSYAMAEGVPYRQAAHGTVRGAQEAKFCAFYNDSALCPTIEEIVSGTAKKPDAVHLAAFAPTLAVALKNDEKICSHFPHVYNWIAGQSAECEVMFAKYAVDLLQSSIITDRECMAVLGKAAKKVGLAVR
ncbi:MAG: hypothetical protein SPJ95_01375, partial [Anaerovoracaceae bacterium]|nr:hypothetical protein [Anaerovoracaceae bacterium]